MFSSLLTSDRIALLSPLLAFFGIVAYLELRRRGARRHARQMMQLSNALEALRESEERFALLAENIPGAIYLCKSGDRHAMHYLNDAVEILTGYAKEDFLKGEISLAGLCHVSDVASIQVEVNQALAEQRPFRLVYRLKHRSGEWRWIEEFGVGIFRHSELLYLEGFLSDFTERKRAEEALRASEQRYRLLFERNLAGVYRTTLDGRILDCNEAFARMCGFASREEVLAHKAWEVFFSVADREAAFARLKTHKALTNFEVCLRRKDNRPIWVLENASLLEGENGTPALIEGTLFDITDRKQAEELLERFKRQNELILNSAGEGIHGLDLKGKTTFINPAAARMIGRGENELVSRTHHTLLHHSKADGTPYPPDECPIFATLRDGAIHHIDNEVFWRKDGTSFPVEYISTPIRDDLGRVVGAVVTFRDITERKHLEEQLRQAQKMEAVGSLAGGVAHDFNNLLTGILGFADLLLDQLGDADPLREDVNEIKKAAERAASLARQLLAFSRQQVLAPQLLDLNTVVTDLDKMLRRLIGEHINLVMVRKPALGQVKGDPGQIHQVILNLAVNARDAMPQGGKLTLETGNVDLDEEYARRHVTVRPGSYVRLTVSDTGIGMDEQTRSRIFDPFFTTKEKGKGTGLGLATVYGIVKQSGGHITVHSEPGRGTAFRIYLPRVEEKPEAVDPGQAGPSAPKGSETLLLVEDEETVWLALRKVLRSKGYTVLEARHGGEALSICERYAGPIHLLVTDVVMPQMSGPELAHRLTPLRPEMKVLYMSGYMDEAIVHDGTLDSEAFLQKPFAPEVLAHKVREVLGAAREVKL